MSFTDDQVTRISTIVVAAQGQTATPRKHPKLSQTSFYRSPAAAQETKATELLHRKSLADYFREKLKLLKRTLLFQRVCIIAENFSAEELAINGVDDPKNMFYNEICRAMNQIQEESFAHDKITGNFLYMGDYSLLVIEANEDMVGEFVMQLKEFSEKFWRANRIVLVEEIFEATYFNMFYMTNASVVHLSEQIPNAAAHDEEFLARQHLLLTQKLEGLCRKLGKQLRDVLAPETGSQGEKGVPKKRVTETEKFPLHRSETGLLEEKKSKSKRTINLHTVNERPLNRETYNKFLPEAERIDVVLAAEDYYFDVQLFSTIYDARPTETDADALIWPVPYNCFPPGLLTTTQFDVNITYGDLYGEELQQFSAQQEINEGRLYPDDDSVTEPISEEAEEEMGSEELVDEEGEEETEQPASESTEELVGHVTALDTDTDSTEDIEFLLEATASRMMHLSPSQVEYKPKSILRVSIESNA